MNFLSFRFVGKICRLVLSTRTHSYHIRFSNSTPEYSSVNIEQHPPLPAFLLHITQVLYIIGKFIPLGCLSFAILSGKPSVPADPFGRRPCKQQDGCPQCRWKHLPLEDPQCQWGNHLVKLIWQWNEPKYPTDLRMRKRIYILYM